MSTVSPSFDFRVKAQPISFFETPVAYCQLDGGESFLDDLGQRVRRQRELDPGVSRSNIGGWHSDTRMLEWGGESARVLGDRVVSIARRLTYFKDATADAFDWPLQMWANITPGGGMNELHVHPGNLWAAVLYLDMGRYQGENGGTSTKNTVDDSMSDGSKAGAEGNMDTAGGNFFIEDPRFPMNVMRNTGMRMLGLDGKPQEIQQEFRLQRGDIVVFPAWLRHGVRPYTGKRERISIAVNIDAIPRR